MTHFILEIKKDKIIINNAITHGFQLQDPNIVRKNSTQRLKNAIGDIGDNC